MPRRNTLIILVLVLVAFACSRQTAAPSPAPAPPTSLPRASTSPSPFTPTLPSPSPLPPDSPSLTPAPPTPTPTSTPTPAPIIIGAIGDYGRESAALEAVATLVNSWEPDLIITLGDNNYPHGSEDTIDQNIGQYFHRYIFPYKGEYGEGASVNRFFPSLGNHDWITSDAQAYLDYFTLPGNERYYDFVWGPVHFFALNSDSHEPDGIGRSSLQAQWLQARLAASDAPWQVVYFHHPPYSSAHHGSVDWMQWPFAEWGADAVLSGHDHTYERIMHGGIPFFVNGLGGASRYDFNDPISGSAVRYRAKHGAMKVTASDTALVFEFFAIDGTLIDSFTLAAAPPHPLTIAHIRHLEGGLSPGRQSTQVDR